MSLSRLRDLSPRTIIFELTPHSSDWVRRLLVILLPSAAFNRGRRLFEGGVNTVIVFFLLYLVNRNTGNLWNVIIIGTCCFSVRTQDYKNPKVANCWDQLTAAGIEWGEVPTVEVYLPHH